MGVVRVDSVKHLADLVGLIASDMGVTPAEAERRKAYLDLCDADAETLRGIRELMAGAHAPLMEEFYDHLLAFEETRDFVDDPDRLEQLQRKQWRYLLDLTAGRYDWSYVQDRLRVGVVHQRVGLEPRWYIGAYGKYLGGLVNYLMGELAAEPERMLAVLRALLKVTFFDIGLVLEAYFFSDRQKLIALKEYSENVVCNVPAGLLVVADDLTILSANRLMDRIGSFAHADLAGLSLEAVIPDADLGRRIREVIGSRAPQYGIAVTRPAQGGGADVFEVSLVPLPELSSADEITQRARVLVVIEDLTEREQLRAATFETDRRMQTIVATVAEGIITIDERGAIDSFNPAAERLFGYTADEVIGGNVSLLMPEPYRSDHDSYLKNHLASGERRCLGTGFREVEGRRKDGTVFPIELSISEAPLQDRRLFVGIVRDISERKREERQRMELQRHLELLLDSTGEGVFGIDLQGRCTFLNRAGASMFGCGDEEALGSDVASLIHPGDDGDVPESDGSRWTEALHLCLSEGRSSQIEEAMWWRRDHGPFPVEYSVRPIRDGERITGAVVTFSDVSERKHTQLEMAKLSRAVEQTADSVIITDSQGEIEYVNAGFEETTGYSRDEALGQTPALVKSGKHDADFYSRLWSTIRSGNVFRDVFINRRKDGSIYYEEKTITPLRDVNGRISHYISSGKDITERMQTQERLQYLAQHDVLTGLPNRMLFMDRLSQVMAWDKRHGRLAALLFMDLDRFKVVNDSLGHHVGDRLLQEIAIRLGKGLRDGDTVARLSGDEFAVILHDIASVEDVSPVAVKLLDLIAQPLFVEDVDLTVTASIGISLFPGDSVDPSELLRHADIAMYRAKAKGRNNYQFYTHDMNTLAEERFLLENNMRKAMERGEFRLHYQPQLSIDGRQVIGMEALIRWESEERGSVPPADFVPILEETGLIVAVGEWVLRTACQELAKLRQLGMHVPRVSVNISPRQLAEAGLFDLVGTILTETGLEPSALELEITETSLMEDEGVAISMLQALSATGVRIAMDDFGTGYSSLNYLHRFPIHTLKIDRSFVWNVPDEPDASALTRAIVAMGHNLNLDVVAEGVETEEQLMFLREAGCDAVQGFLLARPVPPETLDLMLGEEGRAQPADQS